jgi:hypothetical protein
MKARFLGSLALILSLLTSTASATSGNDLYRACKYLAIGESIPHDEQLFTEIARCLEAINTMYAIAHRLEPSLRSCAPDSTGQLSQQLARVVVKWMDKRPERTHELLPHIIAQAFREAWPCP